MTDRLELEYVYFMQNPGMPGHLKIGYTMDPETRKKSLSSTSTPFDFSIVALFQVEKGRICEDEIHAALSEYRNNPRREFFEVSLRVALDRSFPIIQKYLPGAQELLLIEEPEAFGDPIDQEMLDLFQRYGNEEMYWDDFYVRLKGSSERKKIRSRVLIEAGFLDALGSLYVRISQKGIERQTDSDFDFGSHF